MIIVMKGSALEEEIQGAIRTVEELGYQTHVIRGTQRTVIAAVGDERGKARLQSMEALPGVESVVPILQPFKLASREVKSNRTIVKVRDVEIGGDRLPIVAGPCSVENADQILETAKAVKDAGASILRGGAFKPRTSPYAFQGLGEEGLRLLAAARDETGLAIVTEVMKPEDVDLIAEYADMLQVGARNMQNFALLKRVGEARKPVLLKRGISSTIQEFLMAAEYILSEGNYDVVLCERGIRTFETATRFTLDLNAVPVIKKLSHLPVMVDPSHGTGHWEYVTAMAKAGIACGADALMIEVHVRPEIAFSDGIQSLKPSLFRQLMQEIAPFVQAAGRRL
ncbi:MAG TPA: 3-deoxy-7-phosphoheptulonate synthase [Candidatus Methylomirabilis sp.]|nr:3-deoxy-7-phosphoheptulonate synthase [Candidatus Methylomirabilis sp.]